MKKALLTTASIIVFFSTLAIAAPSTDESTSEVVLSSKDSWQQWMKKYDQDRRSDDGWLSLVGLYWMNEGKNTTGSGTDRQHRFPKELPKNFGTITITKDTVIFERQSKDIKIDGKDIESQELILNESVVSFNDYSFIIIKRERGFAIRLKNVNNPAIAKYEGTHFYPYTDSWTIPARLIKHSTPQKINIDTVYETVRENDSAGWIEFEYQGKMIKLQAVSYGKEYPMAIMFADETSQDTTYGAGRFLDVEWPKESDMTIIDFNRAYNPPCAITVFATCPLPPRQNRLDIAVEAGELYDEHESNL